MTTMTVRGIDEQIGLALKAQARKEGLSVNALLLKILKERLGVEKAKRNVLHDDLDALAGTWTDADAAEFEQATAPFGRIDDELWK